MDGVHVNRTRISGADEDTDHKMWHHKIHLRSTAVSKHWTSHAYLTERKQKRKLKPRKPPGALQQRSIDGQQNTLRSQNVPLLQAFFNIRGGDWGCGVYRLYCVCKSVDITISNGKQRCCTIIDHTTWKTNEQRNHQHSLLLLLLLLRELSHHE